MKILIFGAAQSGFTFFLFFLDISKTSALLATLTVWTLNVTLPVTRWAKDHAILLRDKYLLAHFQPPYMIGTLFVLFASIRAIRSYFRRQSLWKFRIC